MHFSLDVCLAGHTTDQRPSPMICELGSCFRIVIYYIYVNVTFAWILLSMSLVFLFAICFVHTQQAAQPHIISIWIINNEFVILCWLEIRMTVFFFNSLRRSWFMRQHSRTMFLMFPFKRCGDVAMYDESRKMHFDKLEEVEIFLWQFKSIAEKKKLTPHYSKSLPQTWTHSMFLYMGYTITRACVDSRDGSHLCLLCENCIAEMHFAKWHRKYTCLDYVFCIIYTLSRYMLMIPVPVYRGIAKAQQKKGNGEFTPLHATINFS